MPTNASSVEPLHIDSIAALNLGSPALITAKRREQDVRIIVGSAGCGGDRFGTCVNACFQNNWFWHKTTETPCSPSKLPIN